MRIQRLSHSTMQARFIQGYDPRASSSPCLGLGRACRRGAIRSTAGHADLPGGATSSDKLSASVRAQPNGKTAGGHHQMQ